MQDFSGSWHHRHYGLLSAAGSGTSSASQMYAPAVHPPAFYPREQTVPPSLYGGFQVAQPPMYCGGSIVVPDTSREEKPTEAGLAQHYANVSSHQYTVSVDPTIQL